jgi:single-strand DNA-binding protein
MNVQFTVAVSRKRMDAGGNVTETTNWYRVTGWGRLAETLDRLTQQGYLAKGRQVFVSGAFEPRDYQDQQGQTRTSLDVNADEVLLIGQAPQGAQETEMGDVPF